MASYLEIDAVIDPADTRRWIAEGLKAAPSERAEKTGHDFVDTW
jgi:acetyl-CoA carboxylase carboxyltransferase component